MSNILDIFQQQQAHRAVMRRATVAQRQGILRRLGQEIQARRGLITDALAQDLGKSRAEAELTEVQQVLGEVRQAIERLPRWARARRVSAPGAQPGACSQVVYEPRGTVLILGPWNYPFNNLLIPFVDALAAGNTVMLKPSEKAPATARAVRELVEAVFEPRLVAAFEGGAEVAQQLTALPFDHIFFTGSGAVGRKVMEAAAQNLCSVSLELGGKSPVLVHESADLQVVAERVAWAKLLNAGQTCMAPDYLLVRPEQKDELISHLKTVMAQRYGPDTGAGDWLRNNPDYGRLIDAASVERLLELVQQSAAQGAKIELGGVGDPAGRFLAPTIVSGVTRAMPLMAQELFGPVLPILTYNDLDSAIADINAGDTPLALYIFGKPQAAQYIYQRTRSGGVAVNGCITQNSNLHLPFGGLGPSGMGNYHGEFGFRTFSHERALITEPYLSTVRLTYPPYSRPWPKVAHRVIKALVEP